ncbi:MAG: TIGR03768 family metallophosphoesterase, partial [Chlamydiota bacterium]
PNRRSLIMKDWMSEFLTTASQPIGHGFNKADAKNGFACYSFIPKSTIPIKVIVLDDTQREDDGSIDIHGHGFLDKKRYVWLKKELASGQAAGQLMIIAAHIPIGVEATDSELGWWNDSKNAVTEPDLINELQSHPNVILWIAGHRHCNTVKAFVSKDPVNHPENSFWQVETSSLLNFPQQFRIFEIYLNRDYTISIVTTNVDPSVKKGTPAAVSRSYAVATQQIVNNLKIYQNPSTLLDASIKPMPTGSYNAELVKKLSLDMETKMRTLYPTP